MSNWKEKQSFKIPFFFCKTVFTTYNGSTLPLNSPLLTNKHISSVHFSLYDPRKLISQLDSNKAHSHGLIGICLLKICDKCTCKPLELVFRSCLFQGIYSPECKKGKCGTFTLNENDKHSVKNYLPVSFIPMWYLYTRWKWQIVHQKLSACLICSSF